MDPAIPLMFFMVFTFSLGGFFGLWLIGLEICNAIASEPVTIRFRRFLAEVWCIGMFGKEF